MYINKARVSANNQDPGTMVHACGTQFESRSLVDMLDNCSRFGQQNTQNHAREMLGRMEKGIWKVAAGAAQSNEADSDVRVDVAGSAYRLHFTMESGELALVRIAH